jgi:hypothetical protein|tara:strand:+ start:29467 stop:30612 length:1146 start_codon:yes stop_codon:yes gene_type:complete
MANILFEGFDVIQNPANLALVHDNFVGTLFPTFPTGRTANASSNCIQVEGIGLDRLRGATSTPADRWGIGMGYSISNMTVGVFTPDTRKTLIELFDGGSTQLRIVVIESDGPANINKIKLRAENGPFASPSTLGPDSAWIDVGENIWNYIEVDATISLTGTVIVKVDNVEVINISGANLRISGTDQADAVEYTIGSNAGSPSPIVKMDDLYAINNDSSSGLDMDVTGLLGPVAVEGIRATNVGDLTDWSSSSGAANHLMLQDVAEGIDHDVTFVKTALINDKELYEFQNPVQPSPTNPVITLEFVVAARKASPGSNRDLQFRYRDNSNFDASMAGVVTVVSEISNQYDVLKKSYAGNPLNSNNPWTKDNLDNGQFGFELVS